MRSLVFVVMVGLLVMVILSVGCATGVESIQEKIFPINSYTTYSLGGEACTLD